MPEKSNEQFEENQNPDAKIAFVMWTPFDFYVFKNIAAYLPESEFVLCTFPFETKYPEMEKKYLDDAIHLLRANGKRWRVLRELRNEAIIRAFFDRFEVVIALHLWKPLAAQLFHEWVIKKKSVLVSYGAGKDLITASPWIAQFDLVLAEGLYTHEIYNKLTNSCVVGSPKFDDWFKESLNEECVSKINQVINKKKKTVLYLPTHSSMSSLHSFSNEIMRLASDYNVLIKLHYLNYFSEREIVEKLQKDEKVHLFDATDDIVPLFRASDMVISDSSSASLEALIVDKPVVILDTAPREKKLLEENNGIFETANQFYWESIEQEIKLSGKEIGEVVRKPEDLWGAVGRAMHSENNQKFIQTRSILKDKLFSYCDENAGRRAAKAIADFSSGKTSYKNMPLMGLSMRAYLTQRATAFRRLWSERAKVVSSLREENTSLKKELEILNPISIVKKFFNRR